MPNLEATFLITDKFSATMRKFSDGCAKTATGLRSASKGADATSKSLKGVGDSASSAASAVKKLAAALGGMAAIRAGISFGRDAFGLNNIQKAAESQLKVVFGNVGAAPGAFDDIAKEASAIQGKTIYGDESMLAGASELATYISDPEAIKRMMGTLSNYAAGMSGGGEVDTSQMVDYATQLGKALDGTYDGLRKKGFELTEAQKAIIENGTDMEKALVLDEVISQSWAGLAEKMANLPENRIIRLKNAIGDMKEVVGEGLTSATMRLVSTVESHLPQIETMFSAFTAVANVGLAVVTAGVDLLGNAIQFVTDNSSILIPIVGALVGAYIALNGAVLATYGAKLLDLGASVAKAAADAAETAAIIALTFAQEGLNAAIALCPISWLVGAVIILVGAFYAGVAAVNQFAGTSISATGIIVGAFAVAGAMIYNGFIFPLHTGFAMLANFVGNVFNNPTAAVKALFYDMAITCVDYVANMARAIESIINQIPGVSVSITSGLDSFSAGLKAKASAIKDEAGWKEFVAAPEMMDLTKAANAGYNSGKGIESKLGGAFSGLISGGEAYKYDDIDFTGGIEAVGTAGNPATVKGTGKGGAVNVNMADEDIQYLRDLAQRDYVAKIATNTLAPNVHVEFTGPVTREADVDAVAGHLTRILRDEIESTAEGVY